MPRGPRGEKRPADVMWAAVRVARISVGEEEGDRAPEAPRRAAAELGKLGGAARAKALTPEKRAEIAKRRRSGGNLAETPEGHHLCRNSFSISTP